MKAMTEIQRKVLDDAEVWLFDLDNTLYPASCNLFEQIHLRMAQFIVEHLGVGHDEAARIRRRYFLEHGTTLCGLMAHHDTDPDYFLRYVHDIDVTPVQPNPGLDAALARLTGRKLIFTNADTGHAENVMRRLGVAHHFEAIFDIAAADYVPKPDPGPYRRIVESYGVRPRAAVMLDDMVRNLAPAAALGMTTVWVRTDHEWSGGGDPDSGHVHHETDDVATWLDLVAPAPVRPASA